MTGVISNEFETWEIQILYILINTILENSTWHGHVLRRDDGHVLRKTFEFEVKGTRKRGRPKKTWKMQVEKESKSVGLENEDAMNRAR